MQGRLRKTEPLRPEVEKEERELGVEDGKRGEERVRVEREGVGKRGD